ncbi:MAG: hypothetical protein R3B09_07495 [Nannocystaceae bacterium]
MRPERLAAVARARQVGMLELVALRADALGDALARDLGLVAWDRQRVVGSLQRALWELRERRFPAPYGGPPVQVIERRAQPLEAVTLAWTCLRRGRVVHVGGEAGASTAALDLLAEVAPRLAADGPPVLTVSGPGEATPAAAASWPVVGVDPTLPRIAVVAADGDRELAAYVLARVCLRRGGADPRGVHQALVCGPTPRLERHLQRLWVGAVMGPPSELGAFAGPVDDDLSAGFLRSLEHLRQQPGVKVLCPGGRLERPDEAGNYLAPALFRAPWPLDPAASIPTLTRGGPLLILHPCEPEALAPALAALGFPPSRQLWVGAPPLGARPPGDEPRYIRGALMTERLPPGLPDPRPV